MVGPKQITSPAMSTQVIQVMLSRLTYRLHGYKELLPMTQQSFHHYQQELNTNEAMFVSVNKLKMSYILRRNEYPSQSDWRSSSWTDFDPDTQHEIRWLNTSYPVQPLLIWSDLLFPLTTRLRYKDLLPRMTATTLHCSKSHPHQCWWKLNKIHKELSSKIYLYFV